MLYWTKKLHFSSWIFIKVAQNHSFTKMLMKNWYMCNLCVIWQYHPYVHLHTVGIIGGRERLIIERQYSILISLDIRIKFLIVQFLFDTHRHQICACAWCHNQDIIILHCHDDVIKWKHFPRYWPFVRGIQQSPVNSPHKCHWHGTLMFSLICAWIKGWVNNGEADDLRHHRAHYDVTVMI